MHAFDPSEVAYLCERCGYSESYHPPFVAARVNPFCPTCGDLTIPATMPESDPSKDYWACQKCGLFATEKVR